MIRSYEQRCQPQRASEASGATSAAPIPRRGGRSLRGRPMIIVTAALKGGVGKTTTSVYLAALAAAAKRDTTLVDSDPQASAADWVESSGDPQLGSITLVEAPTERLLA